MGVGQNYPVVMLLRLGFLLAVVTQISAFQMNLNKQASWFEALKNYIVSPFLLPSLDKQRAIEEKTLAGIALDPAADWKAAWEKNLQRQTLYNNIVKEVFNSFTRMLGWHLISVVLYELLSLGSSVTSRAQHLNIRKIREINNPTILEEDLVRK